MVAKTQQEPELPYSIVNWVLSMTDSTFFIWYYYVECFVGSLAIEQNEMPIAITAKMIGPNELVVFCGIRTVFVCGQCEWSICTSAAGKCVLPKENFNCALFNSSKVFFFKVCLKFFSSFQVRLQKVWEEESSTKKKKTILRGKFHDDDEDIIAHNEVFEAPLEPSNDVIWSLASSLRMKGKSIRLGKGTIP